MSKSTKQDICWRCRGDGSFWICPSDGFNPFQAGGWGTIRAMRKVDPCYECKGTGRAAVTSPESGGK
jgi:hypothetical protein